MILSPIQSTAGFINQITSLVLCYINSRFVILKFIEAPTEFADNFVIIFCFKFISFTFKIYFS